MLQGGLTMSEMEFSNPLLLTAKMFLSEVRSWAQKYQPPHYVCTNFAKVVFDAATIQGIRCGYAIVIFRNGMSHALVAFDTDYGLVYFEPQTGDQEYIEIGKTYSSQLEGVPTECPVEDIKITWNDKMHLRFIRCSECGYLLPISCPICGCGNIAFVEDSW